MVYVSRRYRCEKCRKGFRTHREAEACEIGHITSAAIEDFRETLKSIAANMDDKNPNDEIAGCTPIPMEPMTSHGNQITKKGQDHE